MLNKNKKLYSIIISNIICLTFSCQNIKVNNINNSSIDNTYTKVKSKYDNKKGYFFSGSNHCNYNNILFETYIADLETKEFIKIKSKDENFISYSSKIDNEIILESKNDIKKIDIKTNSVKIVQSNLNTKNVSLDKKNIVFTKKNQDETSVYISDIEGDNQKKIYSIKDLEVTNIIWSPNKEYIAIMLINSNVNIIDKNGKLIKETGFYIPNPELSWSPDGQKLCSYDYNKNILTIIDLKDKKDIVLNTNYGFIWSPDGQKIAFFNNKSTEINLYYFDFETNNQKLIYTSSAFIDIIKWSKNVKEIYFYSIDNRNNIVKKNIYQFNLESNKETIISEKIDSFYNFSLDEDIFTYEKEDGFKKSLYLFNTKNMISTKLLDLDDNKIKNIILSKDKKKLIISMSNLIELSENLLDTNSDIYSLDLDSPNKITRITKSPTDENAYEFISNNKIIFLSQISRFNNCVQEDIENWDYKK